MKEQLRFEYFEVRSRTGKYVVTYFLAESEAKQSDPRKEAAGARARKRGRGFKWRGTPEAFRERGVGRLSRRRHSCAGGRPWVLKRGSRMSGRSGVISLEIRFIESDRPEGVSRGSAPRMGP